MTHAIELDELIRILRRAYSGGKAAALACQGHSRSVDDPGERLAMLQIEMDEWDHGTAIAEMLAALKSAPSRRRELASSLIGHVASAACRVSGWFMPMYIAGQLETGNVVEYDQAAAHAQRLGLLQFAAELSAMARTEHEHETFFKGAIAGRKLARTR